MRVQLRHRKIQKVGLHDLNGALFLPGAKKIYEGLTGALWQLVVEPFHPLHTLIPNKTLHRVKI